MNVNDELFTPDEVAELLGVTPHTLAVWRCEKRYNLPYVKVGRLVRYRRNDLLAFIDSRMQSDNTDME
jgi:excisionase family DNA binding protein